MPADELTRSLGDEPDEESTDERGVQLVLDEVDDPVTHLLRGDIEIEGRMPNSSNAFSACWKPPSPTSCANCWPAS